MILFLPVLHRTHDNPSALPRRLSFQVQQDFDKDTCMVLLGMGGWLTVASYLRPGDVFLPSTLDSGHVSFFWGRLSVFEAARCLPCSVAPYIFFTLHVGLEKIAGPSTQKEGDRAHTWVHVI